LKLPAVDGADPQKFTIRATVAIKADSNLATDELAAETLKDYMAEHAEFLKKYMIRRCTFLILVSGAQSRYFTFKASRDYTEDITIRHIEPFMAHRLEIDRLESFDIKPCLNGSGYRGVRIYLPLARRIPLTFDFLSGSGLLSRNYL
jgi:acetyl-CoA carboxylase/biotin carboxylase 1